MYNENIKKEYIEFKENNTSVPEGFLERLFEKTSEFEEKLNKDLCNFSFYDIQDMLKTFNISSFESLRMMNSHMSLYTQWSISRNMVLDSQNHFLEVKDEIILDSVNSNKVNESVVTRETLLTWIQALENPSDKFLFLALFEGIEGKEFCELANLRMSDFKGNCVKLCTGREIAVSDKLVAFAVESNSTYKYTAVDGKGKKVIALRQEDFIIKSYPNAADEFEVSDFAKGRKIYRKFRRARNSIEREWIKPSNLIDSGIIHLIKEYAKKEGIASTEVVYKHPEIITNQYDYNIVKYRTTFIKKYKQFLEN